jgi:hypothetical protein
MMQREHDVRQAAELWNNGNTLEAGRLLFEMIPPDARPGWASRILRFAIDKSDMTYSPIQEIADIADHPDEWERAHQVFHGLRERTLDLDEKRRKGGLTKQEDILVKLLLIAELVAKVTYNATDPSDEFDEDSGWWIAVTLRDFVDCLDDESFSREAWLTLSTYP